MAVAGEPRIAARGLIVDADGRYVLLRRTRPGSAPRLVVPGGGVGHGESLAAAVHRECAEELGATVRVGDVVLVVDDPDDPPPGALQRFLLCRLVAIDDGARTGHEFREVGRGRYEKVRVAADDDELSTLRPTAVAELIRRRHVWLVQEALRLA